MLKRIIFILTVACFVSWGSLSATAQDVDVGEILLDNGIDPAHPGGSAHLFQQQNLNGTTTGEAPQGNIKYRYKNPDEDLLYGAPKPQRLFNNIPRRRLR